MAELLLAQDSLRLFMSSQSQKFPFPAPITSTAVHLHTSHAVIWIRKPKQLGEGRGGGEGQLSCLRKQSASLLSPFTMYPHADTMWGQKPGQITTVTSAATTTQEVHLGKSQPQSQNCFLAACKGHGTHESSRI